MPRELLELDALCGEKSLLFVSDDPNDADKVGRVLPRAGGSATEDTKVIQVNHPSHYNQGSIECIDAIEDWGLGFNDGNAVKYICRARHKGTQEKDLEKAIWYLKRELANCRQSKESSASRAETVSR